MKRSEYNRVPAADNHHEITHGEKKLANHVILWAAKDMVEAIRNGNKPHIVRECYRFLVGKTKISNFWFNVAGVTPFHDVGVDRLYESFKRL